MDKRKLLLLKYLINNCSDGYKVLETSTILSSIKKYKNDYASLETDINFLKSRKYIDLKYIDENNMCLFVLDNSRVLQENIKIEKGNKKDLVAMMFITAFVSGIMAFIGSFLAIMIFR
ncbi:MAG: hypothetical protein E7354_00525 [Clostridiales bacterium]|nr:hypothetical protein [Clostridiales bacterium]